jgi:putative transposase
MPRTARAVEAGTVYHVLNRGNGRMRLFHKPADYEAFERVLTEGLERYQVDLFTFCVMPNHWHLVVRPQTAEALGRRMGWVGVTYVRRHHAHYPRRGGGHLYQGRFKSFPVASDEYFLALCRYVEANPLRAGLVERAEQWQWSGLWRRVHRAAGLPLSLWPVTRPSGWMKLVNTALPAKSLDQLRECVQRGRPCGTADWVQATATRLDLSFTLRNPGRPRKRSE